MNMSFRRTLAILFFVFALMVAGSAQYAMAQTAAEASPANIQGEKSEDETNLDTQLYLLVATNQPIDDAKLPPALESVVRQLRASLPFKNYRLAATLINRVKNDGRLNLKWIGGPLMVTATASNITPSFNEFRVNNVKLKTDASGRRMVKMEGFAFGARIPIQTATMVAANAPAGPIINYEPTGLNTDISMQEGEPVIVGTLNVGPSGDAIILVISARRTTK
jgi:DNA polymerase III psi subunit